MKQNIICAYLLGALHDGTYNRQHRSWRISQANLHWLELLQKLFAQIHCKSWIYKEGQRRGVFVIETTARFLRNNVDVEKLDTQEKIAYIRGYFDAEGGIPKDNKHWMYIQLSQKNKPELEALVVVLEELGIKCGKVHCPSIKVDPEYWRFYVSRQSHQDFIRIIGSWHPRKQKILTMRVKI